MESAIVRRREAERERVDYWQGARKYYEAFERANNRVQGWDREEVKQARYVTALSRLNSI